MLVQKTLGVLGEHMADYHCQEAKGWGAKAPHDKGQVNPAKLNDLGQLVQLWPLRIRGRGIDAAWKSNGLKPYAVIEAKASTNPLKTSSALLSDVGDKNESNNTGKSGTSGKGGGAGRRGGPSKPGATQQQNGKVMQMSHTWIQSRLLKAVGPETAENIKESGYTRHVLFSLRLRQSATQLRLSNIWLTNWLILPRTAGTN